MESNDRWLKALETIQLKGKWLSLFFFASLHQIHLIFYVDVSLLNLPATRLRKFGERIFFFIWSGLIVSGSTYWWMFMLVTIFMLIMSLAKVVLNLILTRPLKYRWWKCKDLGKNQRLDIYDVYGFWLRYVTRNWHLGSWKMAEEYV